MIPGAGVAIKDAMKTLNRISDSLRRKNALYAIDIMLSNDAIEKEEAITAVAEILNFEYASSQKHSTK